MTAAASGRATCRSHSRGTRPARLRASMIWRRSAPSASGASAESGRLAQVLGADFPAAALSLRHAAGRVMLSGWVGLPTRSRAQPDQQFWFVNGRSVRDRLLMNAVRLAYRDVLYHGRHSAYELYLTLDPKLVDVNAHPAKLEVRFRDSRQIHDFAFRAVERAVAGTKPHLSAASAARGPEGRGAGPPPSPPAAGGRGPPPHQPTPGPVATPASVRRAGAPAGAAAP